MAAPATDSEPIAPRGTGNRLTMPSDVPASGFFRRYRRPVVRDLAWLVLDGALELPAGSGALTTVILDGEERAEFLDLLRQWDDDEEDRWLGPVDPNLRLGLYTERLVGAWLGHSCRIRLLAQNWPLRSSRVTLGEADFLVERRGRRLPVANGRGQGALELWELACKFYLGVPGRGWIGPGLNDSLATKLARMRDHQLRLIHQPGFRAAWHGDWSARAWLAGWLLSPARVHDPPPGHEPPAGRIPAIWAEAGHATLAGAGRSAESLQVEQWWLLPKRRWLRPVHGDEPVAQIFDGLGAAAAFVASGAAPRQRGTCHARPLMLAGVRRTHDAKTEEALRLMLVPPGWTQRAAGSPSGG